MRLLFAILWNNVLFKFIYRKYKFFIPKTLNVTDNTLSDNKTDS